LIYIDYSVIFTTLPTLIEQVLDHSTKFEASRIPEVPPHCRNFEKASTPYR